MTAEAIGGKMMDGEKVGSDAVVMTLKKGCGGEPKESNGGQGCGTTVKRGGKLSTEQ
jgi:hypothetical protein